MKSFKEMSNEELLAQKAELEKRVEEFKAMNLSLNMTRGKPAPNQLAMSNEMYTDLSKVGFKAEDGSDTRNYGVATGLPEVKKLFAEVIGARNADNTVSMIPRSPGLR